MRCSQVSATLPGLTNGRFATTFLLKPPRSRERVKRGACSRLESVLSSRGQRGLMCGGRKRPDAILEVAVARSDLKWLVGRPAATT